MRTVLKLMCLAALVFVAGCTTEAAKKAMAKPVSNDQYSGFDKETTKDSKRKAELPKPVKDDMEPEAAVGMLVKQLQDSQPSFSIAAEEQLMYWAGKQGVAPIVVRRVRPLLKAGRVENRAPAVRLTTLYGGRESIGDLVECLNDSEYGIRDTAYKTLIAYAPQDFGYDPGASETAREKSVNQFRRWWQYDRRNVAVQPETVYEKNPPAEATVTTPGKARAQN